MSARKSKPPRFRRSPHLVCYWKKGRLIFENYATATRVAAEPVVCDLLTFFDRWRPLDALWSRMRDYDPASLRRTVRDLLRHSLLEQSGRPVQPTEQAMQTWEKWNPAAGFFHFSTKDVPYASDFEAVARAHRRRAREQPIPEPVKRYPQARRVWLPKPRSDGEFPRVLLARRTWRNFSRSSIPLSVLGSLLGLTWGVQRWVRVPVFGPVPLKTSPSGGARHPIEVYVLARRVAGLPRGLYHYAADAHCLERLPSRANPQRITRYLPTQWWYNSAAALMLMTAVFPRTQWKYRFSRAYRAVLIEAGHLCQTFCLVATWLGLAPFCSMALADSRIERDLGLDGVTESVLYAAGVGARPPGVKWSPWPSRRRRG